MRQYHRKRTNGRPKVTAAVLSIHDNTDFMYLSSHWRPCTKHNRNDKPGFVILCTGHTLVGLVAGGAVLCVCMKSIYSLLPRERWAKVGRVDSLQQKEDGFTRLCLDSPIVLVSLRGWTPHLDHAEMTSDQIVCFETYDHRGTSWVHPRENNPHTHMNTEDVPVIPQTLKA